MVGIRRLQRLGVAGFLLSQEGRGLERSAQVCATALRLLTSL